jgi:hypothetical protein
MGEGIRETSTDAISLDNNIRLKVKVHGTNIIHEIGLLSYLGMYSKPTNRALVEYIKFGEYIIIFLAGIEAVNANVDNNENTWESNNSYQTYTHPDIEQGLVFHLDFDMAIDDIVYDLSGNELNGTVIGASTSEGIIYGGLYFDGYDDYVEIHNFSISSFDYALGSLSEGTISLWFKLHSFPEKNSVYPIFYFGDDQPNSPTYSDHSNLIIEIGHSSMENRKLYFTVLKDKGVLFCFNSSEDLELHHWYHFVTVINMEDYYQGTQQAYLNSRTMPSRYNFGDRNHPCFIDDVPSKEVCWIGRGFYRYKSELFYLHGQVDEIRIYDRPLNQLEVQQLYDQKHYCCDSDINRDRQVNIKDFAVFADNWLTENSAADINYDGVVDFLDLSDLSFYWLYSCFIYE